MSEIRVPSTYCGFSSAHVRSTGRAFCMHHMQTTSATLPSLRSPQANTQVHYILTHTALAEEDFKNTKITRIAPKEANPTVVWTEKAKSLRSSKQRLTKVVHSAFGNFTLTIFALRQWAPRGMNSMAACGGIGYIEVKCNSCNAAGAATLHAVTATNKTIVTKHDFHADGVTCRLPKPFKFACDLDQINGTFDIVFHFRPRHVDDE